MKLFGKYRYIENGEVKTKRYVVRKRIPKFGRRIIIWGPPGYGKSSILVENSIRKERNVLYISTVPFGNEWGHMYTDVSVFVHGKIVDVKADFTGKVAYDLGQISQTFMGEVVPYLESSGITSRKNVTIILDNLSFLTREAGILDEITQNWKCKVLLDLTCGKILHQNETPLGFASKDWKSVPVFTPLFTRYDDDLT